MKIKLALTLTLGMFAVSNCASLKPHPYVTGSFVRLAPAPMPATVVEPNKTDINAVEVYYKKEITIPHKELGIVEAVARGSSAGLGELIPELQRQAAMLGARAIKKVEIQRYDHAGPAIHATALAVDFK